jgi:hypothetical protein
LIFFCFSLGGIKRSHGLWLQPIIYRSTVRCLHRKLTSSCMYYPTACFYLFDCKFPDQIKPIKL